MEVWERTGRYADSAPVAATGQFVGAAVGASVAVSEGNLVELLARLGRVLPRDAGATQVVRVQADAACDRLDGQVQQTVGAQLRGHRLLLRLGQARPLHEARRE